MAVSPRRLARTRFGKDFSEGARLLWLAISGMTQSDAKDRIGCSAGMLTHWLYGDRRPSAEWLARIEDAFDVPAGEWGRPPTEPFTLPAVEQADADESGDHPAIAHSPTGTGPHTG